MKLEQSFEVEAPLERVWQTLIDVEHVAPCLPGAAVTGRNDDGSYNGTFTVKIGPTTASYTGRLEMENIDEASHTATMQAQGTDKRGQGGAKATIHSRLAPVNGRGTRVDVVTDYHITGRLARFGRGGMIEDISERLLREFAKRLQSSLSSQQDTIVSAPAEPAPVAAGEPEAPVAPVGEPAGEPAEPTRDHTVFAPVPTESAPSEAPVSPAGDVTPPPPPPPATEPITPPQPWSETSSSAAEPAAAAPESAAAVPEPTDPASGPSPVEPAEPPAPVAEPSPVGDAGAAAPPESPAPPPPPSPGPPPVVTPPPAPAAPPAGERPPLQHPPEPSEPMQGLSLVGGVVWKRVKRNPAPAAAAGVAVMLLLARRRRRRH
jgi:carbon monoxide dehydrogenase subunit G